MERIQEIEKRWKEDANPDTAMIYAPSDVRYLLSEVKRYREGYEVLSAMPMHTHPSETRNFSKRMLRGEKPYTLNDDQP